MRRIWSTLRSERGDLAVESIVGTTIVALMSSAVVLVMLTLSQASVLMSADSQVALWLRSQIAQQVKNIHDLPTAELAAEAGPVEGSEREGIYSWREDLGEFVSLVYVSTPRDRDGLGVEDCAPRLDGDVLDIDTTRCLVEVSAVDLSLGGVATPVVETQISESSPNVLEVAIPDTAVEADFFELRYVFEAYPANESLVQFEAQGTDGQNLTHTVALTNQGGYHYGGVEVGGLEGPMTVTFDSSVGLVDGTAIFYEVRPKDEEVAP